MFQVFFAFGGTLAVILAMLFLNQFGWRVWIFMCALPALVFLALSPVSENILRIISESILKDNFSKITWEIYYQIWSFWLQIIPESPRFDLARGRPDLAHRTLEKAAKFNGRKLPDGQLEPLVVVSFIWARNLISISWYLLRIQMLSFSQKVSQKIVYNWRIQDFPEGCQPIIWPIFPKNCMKIKKFWSRG